MLARYFNVTLRNGFVTFSRIMRLNKQSINTKIMKSKSIQQEVLLLTGTNFSNRQWSTRDDNTSKSLSEEEKLEQACWNGLLPEMLPEIFDNNDVAGKLFLWEIKEGASFLELEMGEYPEAKDNYYSIDPYSFLTLRCAN